MKGDKKAAFCRRKAAFCFVCVDSLLTESLYLSVDDVDIACLWVFG